MDFKTQIRLSGVANRTARRYAKILQQTIDIHGCIDLNAANSEILKQLNNDSFSNVNKYVSAYRAYCSITGDKWGDQLRRVTEKPVPKRVPRTILARDICFVIDNKYSILFELMFLTGMRLDECRRLKGENISKDEIIIEQAKSGGRRVATPPFQHVQKRLFDYLDSIDSVYAFPNGSGGPVSDTSCRKEFNKRLKLLGVKHKYTPHSFRSSFMTRNLRNGAVLFDVQQIVGHKKADTTAIYYRGNIDTQREVMKNDPANVRFLPASDQLKLVIDDLKKSGILDNKLVHHEITERSIKIEIKGDEAFSTKEDANPIDQKNNLGGFSLGIEC